MLGQQTPFLRKQNELGIPGGSLTTAMSARAFLGSKSFMFFVKLFTNLEKASLQFLFSHILKHARVYINGQWIWKVKTYTGPSDIAT